MNHELKLTNLGYENSSMDWILKSKKKKKNYKLMIFFRMNQTKKKKST